MAFFTERRWWKAEEKVRPEPERAGSPLREFFLSFRLSRSGQWEDLSCFDRLELGTDSGNDSVHAVHAAELSRAGGFLHGWRGVVILAAVVAVLRGVYLTWLCPYELVADEAQYWDWSRRPSLSYYSKGPGVAWPIGLSEPVDSGRS